jgi:hypothetical protein
MSSLHTRYFQKVRTYLLRNLLSGRYIHKGGNTNLIFSSEDNVAATFVARKSLRKGSKVFIRHCLEHFFAFQSPEIATQASGNKGVDGARKSDSELRKRLAK